MNDEPTERNVEALPQAAVDWADAHYVVGLDDDLNIVKREATWRDAPTTWGEASDWYAERIAQARREGAAKALEQAADVGPSSTATDQLWRMWIRDRATALRGTP